MNQEKGEIVFSGFGIDIIERKGSFFIRYDEGEISDQIIEQDITKDEAISAQLSEDAAYRVIIAAQNRSARLR